MTIQIQAVNHRGVKRTVSMDRYPDCCPLCNMGIQPIYIGYAVVKSKDFNNEDDLQLVFKCPREDCSRIFVSYYKSNTSDYSNSRYVRSLPIQKRKKRFPDHIERISPVFCEIYNEASFAEQDGCMKICGVGYRKALEYLIKDYLILVKDDKKDEIKVTWLGSCIDKFIDDEKIKETAKRAAWLGNDETHYERIWEDKDLSDLKRLIDMTVHWIEMAQQYQEVVREMPSN